MSRVDETKLVDREQELIVLADMLLQRDHHRVLVISDGAGVGKTDLLRKLRLTCERDYGFPVSLVHLGDFVGFQDEFAIVECMHKALKGTGAELTSFDEVNAARGLGDTTAFLKHLDASGVVDARNAIVQGAAKVAGMMVNIDKAENVTLPGWDSVMDSRAKELCVSAFLQDLESYTLEKPLALLFDDLEKVDEALRRWILSEVVRRRALSAEAGGRLVVVLAGQDASDLVYGRLPKDQHEYVRTIGAGAQWHEAEFRMFLAANGFGSLSRNQVAGLYLFYQDGDSLAQIIVHATIAKGAGKK
jgi:hypothetical protein